MKHFLVVVDMQKDFVNGALGTKEAEAIVPCVVEKINKFIGDNIFVTYDTHFENYANTLEGKKLPVPHCIKHTDGWQLDKRVAEALAGKEYLAIEKNTFGSTLLPALITEKSNGQDISIEVIGLCTDICVVSNVLMLRASFPNSDITVDSSCCAGVTPETHQAALTTMKMCQINII